MHGIILILSFTLSSFSVYVNAATLSKTADVDGSLSKVELTRGMMAYGRRGPTVITDSYAVIIDGGSSHTDLRIYKWPSEKVNGTGMVEENNKVDCKSRLSSVNMLVFTFSRGNEKLA